MPAENFEAEPKTSAAEYQNNLLADAYDWACDNPGKTAGIAAVGVLLISKGRIPGQLLKSAEKEAALDIKAEIFPLQALGGHAGAAAAETRGAAAGAAEKQAKELMTSAFGRRDLFFDGKAPNVKAEESIKNWLQSHGHKIRYTDDLSGRLGQP